MRLWKMYALAIIGINLCNHTTNGDVVIPTNVDSSIDGNDSDSVTGDNHEKHIQYMYADGVLALVPGDQITGIAWRLDPTFGTYESGWPIGNVTYAKFDVMLSQAATTLETMSSTFADNMLNPVNVRSGALGIPAGSFEAVAVDNQTNSFYQMVTFATAYTYHGGDLIVDINHGSSNGDGFTFDAVSPIDVRNITIDSNTSLVGDGTVRSWAPVIKLIVNPTSAPPVNDLCANARAITTGEGFDTTLATNDGSASCSASTHDVWYTYTAPSNIPATGIVATCTAVADAFFPVLSAYDGSCVGQSLGCAFNGQTSCQLDVPVFPNQTIYLRLAGATSHNPSFGRGSLNIFLHASNDACASSQLVTPGTYTVDTAWATPDVTATCDGYTAIVSGTFGMPTLWYHYQAPANVSDKIEFGAQSCPSYPSRFPTLQLVLFDRCNGNPIDCGGNCGNSGVAEYLTSNGEALLVLASGANNGTPPVYTGGSLLITATPVSVWDEYANGGGDSGDAPGTAQVVTGTGPVTRILGEGSDFHNTLDRDWFKIQICDAASFSATSAPNATFPGTRSSVEVSLSIYDEAGDPILLTGSGTDTIAGPNIITGGTVSNGTYYLEVASIYGNLVNEPYRIALTGACRIVPPCPADFDHSGTVNVSDIFAFLRAWFAHSPSADIDGNGSVNVSDIFAFLRHWFAHC